MQNKSKVFLFFCLSMIFAYFFSRNTAANNQESTICLICLEAMQKEDTKALPCNPKHIFHKQCINELFKKNYKCPLCRTIFTKYLIEYMYKKLSPITQDELIHMRNYYANPELTREELEVIQAIDMEKEVIQNIKENPIYNINYQEKKDKETLLHILARHGNIDTIRALSKKPHLKCNLLDNEGLTPLLIILYKAYENKEDEELSIAIAKILLSLKDINLDAQEKDHGNTSLMYCAKIGNVELTKKLIKKGVNLNLKNKYNETALSIATKQHTKTGEEKYKKVKKALLKNYN